jgi:hypothetical protein
MKFETESRRGDLHPGNSVGFRIRFSGIKLARVKANTELLKRRPLFEIGRLIFDLEIANSSTYKQFGLHSMQDTQK